MHKGTATVSITARTASGRSATSFTPLVPTLTSAMSDPSFHLGSGQLSHQLQIASLQSGQQTPLARGVDALGDEDGWPIVSDDNLACGTSALSTTDSCVRSGDFSRFFPVASD
jgi:hypothetical protein